MLRTGKNLLTCLTIDREKVTSSEMSKNGIPRPNVYTANCPIPWYNDSDDPAKTSIEESASPTHGVQPAPISNPRINEPSQPPYFFSVSQLLRTH
ncbi:hypothetical protein D1872_186520 [compost metagenome]